MDGSPKAETSADALKRLSEMTSKVSKAKSNGSVLQKMTGDVKVTAEKAKREASNGVPMKVEIKQETDTTGDTNEVLATSPNGQVTIRKEINDNEIHSLPSGMYGIAIIDGIRLPYLIREHESFVSVRMVERLFLSKYPNHYPDEIKRVGPLISHYASKEEVQLMNDMDRAHAGAFLNGEAFTDQELLVQLSQFSKFLEIVKKHFSNFVDETHDEVVGWVQLNNTVIPYVKRNGVAFLPLSVVRYAAKLLEELNIRGLKVTEQEVELLNDICSKNGIQFTFTTKCKLIQLQRVQELAPGATFCAKTLAQGNPFTLATYIDQNSRLPPLAEQNSRSPPAEQNSRLPPALMSSTEAATMALVQSAIDAAKQSCVKAGVSSDGRLLIRPLTFEKRAVSCLLKPDLPEAFALIEAVAKLYFPHISIVDIQVILVEKLHVPLYTLNAEEEKAFIRFYQLPTEKLKCNKAIGFGMLAENADKLREIYKEQQRAELLSGAATQEQSDDASPLPSPKAGDRKRKVSDRRSTGQISTSQLHASSTKHQNKRRKSHPVRGLVNVPAQDTDGDGDEDVNSVVIGSSDSEVSDISSRSNSASPQSQTSPNPPQPPKQKRGLEDTVSRLMSLAAAKQS